MKNFLGISAIILIGLAFRLIFIDKPDGLWNDEYVSWMIAAKPFAHGFLDAVRSQCHMPFYYLYLKIFMAIFGQSDLVLRLSSVLCGILSILAMYFTGLEKDKNTAFLCAGFCAISSFLIYYSQEVRLYSVLFLFSALTLLFTLRIVRNPNKKNIILYILCNFLILFTHTIGFVYVFFNLVFVSLNLYKNFKKTILYIWYGILSGAILCTPLIIKIFSDQTFSQWWGHFSISKIGFLITDYFSPVLTNLTNAPDNFLYAPQLLFFMLAPAIIAVSGIIIALKNEQNRQLFLIALFTLCTLTAASISGKLVFITKYSIEIYPILIYLACYGISSINNVILRKSLIIFYTLLSVGYILIHPYSAPKMHRAEGHKIAADMLSNAQLKKNDFILLEYYNKDRFEKYFDFTDYNTVSINKSNFARYMDEDTYNIHTNGKTVYKAMFLSKHNTHLESMLENEIFKELKPGQNLAIVVLNSVAFYSPEQIITITEDENKYNKTPLLFLVFSYIKNQTFLATAEKLAIRRIEQKGNWTVIKFTKLNN